MTAVGPKMVAFVRGILIVAAGAAIAAAVSFATSVESVEDAWWLVPVVAGLRWAEGWYDANVRNQAPQEGILGGRPADPGAYLP